MVSEERLKNSSDVPPKTLLAINLMALATLPSLELLDGVPGGGPNPQV
jgi:hypothetical protein